MNKKVLIGAIAILVLIIGVSSFLIFGRSGSSREIREEDQAIEIIPTIAPEEIGFDLTAGKGGKTVILEVAKTDGLKAIEYTLSYMDKDNIERGAYGQLELKTTPAIKEITLGTCSDVCHYDEGVTSVKIVLKVTKNDGKVYQLEKILEL